MYSWANVSRYTLTYTPSLDRILPSPQHLHVKIRNTSAIPLRAAYLVGPYTLYTACYPSTFDPNYKKESTYQDGVPEFEPNLKAGGSWTSRLTVPEHIRETAGKANVRRSTDGQTPSFTWFIEISSQVIFSTSAAVHFELLVGRDERSIELGFAALNSKAVAAPGQLEDHQQSKRSKEKDGKHSAAQPKGVFSHAVNLIVDDTASLWNKPPLPEWDNERKDAAQEPESVGPSGSKTISPRKEQGRPGPAVDGRTQVSNPRKRKRVHLVILTHGLHSNLGADMLYLKESIDAAAKQAREDARKRKREERESTKQASCSAEEETENSTSQQNKDGLSSPAAAPAGDEEKDVQDAVDDADGDEEEVMVRGFAGNSCRTERGIQYLGKRLAKYILSITYPDQEYLPKKQSVKKKLSRAFAGDQPKDAQAGTAQHNRSSIYHPSKKPEDKAYNITSISFIAHSLGGLTQTYAIAYIHKHSPHFFDEIKPINFISMAAPFLGLSNENPMYVKFALDFGLVGRTGQDLGLTWRAPTMVRSGWGAMIGGIGNEGQRAKKQPDPGSKPLLRILPTGHTHQVLKKFRNRTVYSNVVNDGIVPLRTSCLLFLDWSGLGRVEKARRENGLIGTGLSWGWAELTGANASSKAHLNQDNYSESWSQSDVSGDESSGAAQRRGERTKVPQPAEDAVKEDNTAQEQEAGESKKPKPDQATNPFGDEAYDANKARESPPQQPTHPMTGLLSFLRPSQEKKKSHHHSPKYTKIYTRSQTTKVDVEDTERQGSSASSSAPREPSPASRPGPVRGDSTLEDPKNVYAPPKTTIFESAGDVLNPPLPSKSFLVDPKSRPRTIFHDRVYHPEDIPPPPSKKPRGLSRTLSAERASSVSLENRNETPDLSSMKVEEKIARAYHHGLSWRKVLVRLEPDAHNNMVVRRMFANAYGWPVVKHLVDTHFSDTYAANTADVNEPSEERARPMHEAVGEHGEEVDASTMKMQIQRSDSEVREAKDRVPDLKGADAGTGSMNSSFSNKKPSLSREDSARWDDALFEVSDSEDEDGGHHSHAKGKGPHVSTEADADEEDRKEAGTSEAEIADFLTKSPVVHSPQEMDKGAFGTPAAPGSSAAVKGLGKSVEEQLHLNELQDKAAIGL